MAKKAKGKPNSGSGVGYGRPPKHSQFRPGQSGYPQGRQKGTRNFKTDVKRTLTSPVKLVRDGIAQWVSTQEAALLRLREKAIGAGVDTRALDRLIALAEDYNNEDVAEEQSISENDEAILEIYRQHVLREAAAVAAEDRKESDRHNDSNSPNKSTDQTSTEKE